MKNFLFFLIFVFTRAFIEELTSVSSVIFFFTAAFIEEFTSVSSF
jgi:hypothetical protein